MILRCAEIGTKLVSNLTKELLEQDMVAFKSERGSMLIGGGT